LYPQCVAGIGHLILADRAGSDVPGDALGALVETRHRDIAAVFGSRLRDPASYLQTAAHEIGHMFDLRHGDGQPVIPTAMCQTKDRRGRDIDGAWLNLPGNRPSGLLAFPFSRISTDRIERQPTQRIPGGGKFNPRPGETPFDSLAVSLEPERDTGRVGESFGFRVMVRNTSGEAIEMPSLVRPELGNLLLKITWPDRTTFFYRPASSVCFDHVETLGPGGLRCYNQILLRGLRHHVFPEPGRFRIGVCGNARQSVAEMEVGVLPRQAEPLPQSFSQFINQGAPSRMSHQRRRMNRMLDAGDPAKDPFLAHLALLKARTLRMPKATDDLLTLIEHSEEAPRAIRHAAFYERFWRASHEAREELLKLAEVLFDDPVRDRDLYVQLRTLYEP
jgi:hypothetical protein